MSSSNRLKERPKERLNAHDRSRLGSQWGEVVWKFLITRSRNAVDLGTTLGSMTIKTCDKNERPA